MSNDSCRGLEAITFARPMKSERDKKKDKEENQHRKMLQIVQSLCECTISEAICSVGNTRQTNRNNPKNTSSESLDMISVGK